MYKDWELPSLNADPNFVTMSGHSGGAYQANIMSIINENIKGVGLFNGGPYGSSVYRRK